MATHYTVRIVAKGSEAIMRTSKVQATLRDARRLRSEWLRDAVGQRVEIVRHRVEVVK